MSVARLIIALPHDPPNGSRGSCARDPSLGGVMVLSGAKNFGKPRAPSSGLPRAFFFAPDAHSYSRGGPPAGNRAAAVPARLIQLAWRWCLTWCEQLCRAPISLSFAERVVEG